MSTEVGSSVDTDASTSSAPAVEGAPLADALGEPLKKLDLLLDELQARQEHVTMLLDEQSANCDSETYAAAHKLMLRTHVYYRKLVMARKSMLELHSRSQKLKARANKLRQIAEARRLKMERSEQAILARPVRDK